MTTSLQDPERANRQFKADIPPAWTPPLSEGDWVPLLCGLGLAISVVLMAVGSLHMYLRFVRW